MNRIDLDGRRAVVTGGAGGVGLAVARRLVASGARVSLWDRDAGALAAAGVGDHTQVVDQSDHGQVQQAADATCAALGGIDILVNNAGVAGPVASVVDCPVDTWHEVIAIDLNGVFHCLKAVLPTMIAAGYGRIVNVASIAGKEGNPNSSAYSAAKAGVIALTKSLAKELADVDIAVNCITPSILDTPILSQLNPEHVQRMLAKIPRGRFLTVDEAASMIAWLVSSENSFATGAAFDLSGGRATY